MTKLNENSIEKLAIELLKKQGYQSIYAPDIAPNSERRERKSYGEVLLIERLKTAVCKLNPDVAIQLHEEAIKQIQHIRSSELLVNNETFHRMLTEGIKVSYQKDGYERGDLVWLIDFETPERNEFIVVNQFTVIENGNNKRLDLILFVNGLPLVVIELKNPASEHATLKSAFQQIETYKKTIPSLFTYNGFNILSDGHEARAGALSAGFDRFMTWKSADGKKEASSLVSQLKTLISGMLNKATLLDLIRHFIVFEESEKKDTTTHLISIAPVKKLAAYHQYYAVNRALESTLRASGYSIDQETLADSVMESPQSYRVAEVKKQSKGDRKGGVVWHTQGSGKSLTMVFFTGKIVLALNNPTILIITDRNDLDDQLFNTFAKSTQLLRQRPEQAKDRDDLKEKLKVASGGVIFSTIQKFQPESGNVYETLSTRENIVVIADEAHRTQYGFKAQTIDIKNEQGTLIGKKTVYGFAKYLRDALPNATYLGFTGTPIEKIDVNTPAVFGNYIDVYDIAQAVEDGATVPIYYESRLVKVNLSDEGRQLVKDLEQRFDQEDLNYAQKSKWARLEALVGSENRVKNIAQDIVTHFEQRQEVASGKGMIVTISRKVAVNLYEAIIQLRPEWHTTELDKGAIKIVMTSNSADGPKMAKHHTTKQQRRVLVDRMKNPEDELKLVIVCDMWLTGFDVPNMHTLYIDKPMKGHGLMQAIARVNRVYKDKPGGLVVDYLGIASELKQALSFYSDAGGKGTPTINQEEAVKCMLEKFEVVANLFHGFDYQAYFDAETSEKLALILAAEEHILGLEEGKKRYLREVSELSKSFALAIPHEKTKEIRDEVAFFQAVKARLAKFAPTTTSNGNEDMETSIRQVIDKALVSNEVVDIFDAAGIKKPNISILSEEFLLELKGMAHKNLALEVLKKLLNDEIKARSKKNLVKGKTFMEMLEESIKKYNNKVLTTAEAIDALIQLSKKIINTDREAKTLGLTEIEYAFYTAVAENESARELMGKDKLIKLARIVTEKIRKNTTIDWTIRESVQSKLRIGVRRTLRKFGYPPDMQTLATAQVLKQAEMIASELSFEAQSY